MSFPSRSVLVALGVYLSLSLGAGSRSTMPWAAQSAPPVKPAAAAQAAGPGPMAARQSYQRFCTRCHGDDHTGSDARADFPEIPDFTTKAWQASRTDAQLLVSILKGKGRHMPPFGERLTAEQARDLVTYLRRLGGGPGAAADPAKDFPRRFDELVRMLQALQEEFRRLGDSSAAPAEKSPSAPTSSRK